MKTSINTKPFLQKYGTADFLKRVCESYTFCIWKYKREDDHFIIEEVIRENHLYKSFPVLKAETEKDTIYIVSFDNQFLFFEEELYREYESIIKIILTPSLQEN